MSRGRGGFRGPAGTHRIAGVDIPADADIQLDQKPPPTPDYPGRDVGPTKRADRNEKLQSAKYRHIKHRIQGGPMHSILGHQHRVTKPGSRAKSAAAHFDPFEGMETWSQKYAPKKQRMPKLSERPYVFRHFPKELWTTLDPHQSTANGVAGSGKSKKTLIFDREVSDDEDPADVYQDGEVPPEDEEVDDDYADDESEGDYNAEQYFEGGDELDGDDDGDGGGVGGDYD
ncbi:hypothetical protein MMC14_010791 [Varicellaria rhodocarpa]|nr:hypothetical protein [Varicellaria rhodocarpa]